MARWSLASARSVLLLPRHEAVRESARSPEAGRAWKITEPDAPEALAESASSGNLLSCPRRCAIRPSSPAGRRGGPGDRLRRAGGAPGRLPPPGPPAAEAAAARPAGAGPAPGPAAGGVQPGRAAARPRIRRPAAIDIEAAEPRPASSTNAWCARPPRRVWARPGTGWPAQKVGRVVQAGSFRDPGEPPGAGLRRSHAGELRPESGNGLHSPPLADRGPRWGSSWAPAWGISPKGSRDAKFLPAHRRLPPAHRRRPSRCAQAGTQLRRAVRPFPLLRRGQPGRRGAAGVPAAPPGGPRPDRHQRRRGHPPQLPPRGTWC